MIRKLINTLLYLCLSPSSFAKYKKVKIGKNCRIVSKNWGSEPYLIEIGNHVHITKGVSFVTHDGSVWVFRRKIPDFDVFGKIKIRDNTYIGNNTTILPGVTIGENCIVGANSVVTKSVPDNFIVAGNPARYISKTEVFLKKIISYNCGSKFMKSDQKKEFLLKLEENKFIRKNFIEQH